MQNVKTLQISEQEAIRLYPSADAIWKKVLEDTFGTEFFNQSITDRVKSFENACSVLGIDHLNEAKGMKDIPKDEIAYKKLKIICKALNEGWQPDWKNADEWKYYPWFDMSQSSASGLAFDGCVDLGRSSDVGSRLCFKTSDLAEYAGKQFADLYADFFLM